MHDDNDVLTLTLIAIFPEIYPVVKKHKTVYNKRLKTKRDKTRRATR